MIPPRYLKVVTCSSSASSITSLHWTGSLAIAKFFVLEVETAMLYVFAVVQNQNDGWIAGSCRLQEHPKLYGGEEQANIAFLKKKKKH